MDRFLKILGKVGAVFFVLSFAVISCFIAIVIPACSKAFYKDEFNKTLENGHTIHYIVKRETYLMEDVQSARFVMEMTEDELIDLMMHTVRYCFYLEEDLNPTIDGYQLKLYRQDEISHMQDVKAVFGGGLVIVGVSVGVFIITLCIGLVKRKSYYENCRKVPIYALIGVLLVFLIIGIASMIWFDKAFDIFHKLLFDGNWEFETGVMIKMIGYVFDDIFPIILTIWLTLLALFGVGILRFNKKIKK